MPVKKVTIGFTSDEFSNIQKFAQEQGISIAQYIKSKVIPNEFDVRYEELLQKVDRLEHNKEFSIKELWEKDEWDCISRGVRLSLGRHFYRNVVETQPPKIDNVKKSGFGVAGIMRYIKISHVL
jgi:hypothetical protein